LPVFNNAICKPIGTVSPDNETHALRPDRVANMSLLSAYNLAHHQKTQQSQDVSHQ